MELPDLKQLQSLIAVCRKSGVSEVEFNGMRLTFIPIEKKAPRGKTAKAKSATPDTGGLDPVTDGWDNLSEDQKIFWSSERMEIPTEQGPGKVQ